MSIQARINELQIVLRDADQVIESDSLDDMLQWLDTNNVPYPEGAPTERIRKIYRYEVARQCTFIVKALGKVIDLHLIERER